MEALNLNRIPVGSNPVVHVSQYDVGRVFRFNLFDGSNVYTLDGTETIECNVRKLDGNVVTVGVTNTSSDYIDVITTEQMTAIHGQNYGEIVFKKGGNVIGSVNFILQVEQSPLEGGITSDSAIYNLQVQVANYVAIEVANQYDSANVIFDATPTVGHGNGYTVTSEGIGTALDTKQDNITTKTASGDLITITDGGDNIPMKSLESEIVAVESGSGEKSPTNPYTISGFDSGIVTRCGKNLVDTSLCTNRTASGITTTLNANGSINLNGTASASARWWHANDDMTILLKAGTYTTSTNVSGVGLTLFTSEGYKSGTFTLTRDMLVTNLIFELEIGRNYNVDVLPQLEVGNQATTYEAYNGNTYTFTFGQTVYGGHFDNKGNLVVTHGVVDLSTLSWTHDNAGFWYSTKPTGAKNGGTGLCSTFEFSQNDILIAQGRKNGITIYQNGNVYVTKGEGEDSPIGQLVFELANPIVLSITSQDIPTLSGENNIFSNCGDTAIEYFPNTTDGLVTLIKEFTVTDATELPISDSDPTDTKSYIDGEVTTLNTAINTKQNANVLNIVKHYDSGTSSDALTDLITTYGAVNMVFAFDIPLGYFTGCLTFVNDNVGSGFIVLSTTGRFWVVSYVSGTITLTELT